jgi:hypothetical protein
MKNCLIVHEFCGKEGKLKNNSIPARKQQNSVYLVTILEFYVLHV